MQELVRTEQACPGRGAGATRRQWKGAKNQREAANLAWAKGFLILGFLPSAQANGLTRPQGWETTLEPYRMLNHEARISFGIHLDSNGVRPPFEDEEWQRRIHEFKTLSNRALYAPLTEFSNGVVSPFNLADHPFGTKAS